MTLLEFAGQCVATGALLMFIAWSMAVANTSNGRTPTKGEDRVMGWFAVPALIAWVVAIFAVIFAALQTAGVLK